MNTLRLSPVHKNTLEFDVVLAVILRILPGMYLGMCAVTSFDVYCESVVLLGIISRMPAKDSVRGIGYSTERPTTVGDASVSVVYCDVITICAVCGVIATLLLGITAWHERENSNRSLLNCVQWLKFVVVAAPEKMFIGSSPSRDVTVLRYHLSGLPAALIHTSGPAKITKRPW